MAYQIYLDKILLPVTPEKIQIKHTNQNKTINLINDGEYSILKQKGLSEISFDALIPSVTYPFAVYKNGFITIDTYLKALDELENKSFKLKIIRQKPKSSLHGTEMLVSLESYTIKEDADYGFDTIVSISLKEYKECVTKTYSETISDSGETVVTETINRQTDTAQIAIGSTVLINGNVYTNSGGAGESFSKNNYTGKVNFIDKAGLCPYHIADLDGVWLGWVLASAVEGI